MMIMMVAIILIVTTIIFRMMKLYAEVVSVYIGVMVAIVMIVTLL